MATGHQGGNKGGQGSGTSNRGFASMDPERQREIASEGGKAAHEKGTAHEFTSEEARRAGSMSHGNRQSESASTRASAGEDQKSGRGESGSKQSESGGSKQSESGGSKQSESGSSRSGRMSDDGDDTSAGKGSQPGGSKSR
jgi:hypothetical protein